MPRTEAAPSPLPDAQQRRVSSRLLLSVAPRANARLRHTPAAITRQALSPRDAVNHLRSVLAGGPELDIVGLGGPGDPLATPDVTLLALELVREAFPNLSLCLSTNGIGGEKVARELAGIGLDHVAVQASAVRPEVAEKLYLWIRPGTRTVPLADACAQLLAEQERAVAAFKREGIRVLVEAVLFPGLNAGHLEEVAARMAELGADAMSVAPCFAPEEGAEDPDAAPCPPAPELLELVRARCARFLPQEPAFDEDGTAAPGAAQAGPALPKPSEERPNVAVASSTGMDVDLHLGHAHQFLIYGREGNARDGLIRLLGTRPAPEPGGGDARWETTASTLGDCFALLAASAGARPREVLGGAGLRVVVTDGNIEGTVEALYGEGKKPGKRKRPTV
jgi:nitrogen fixation protein NifB